MNSNGMHYAPLPLPAPVVQNGEFPFAAASLDHGHIYGMCEGLLGAGGTLTWVYDDDPGKIAAFCKRFPMAKPARSLEEILEDPSVRMVAGAAVPNLRAPLGWKVMDAEKDYFTDKCPFTTLSQLERSRAKAAETGRKYMVYYSERLHCESAIFAGQLIREGAIGRVLQVIGLGPHRLSANSRPPWFFRKEEYGGILCDIGSHQIEQILFYTGAKDAVVTHSQVANYHHPDHPELEDYGDCSLLMDNGATGFFRVDWFTPDGLQTWGDGRAIILGTDGFMELRKYTDIGTEEGGGQLILVNQEKETKYHLHGKVGYPFFGELILDCLHRTEHAMTQDHAFKAAELCLKAQQSAQKLGGAMNN